jgi:hypothetical protein
MNCTVHVRCIDDSFTEWTVESMPEARRAVEALGLRIGFNADEGWSDAHPRTLAKAATVTTSGADS